MRKLIHRFVLILYRDNDLLLSHHLKHIVYVAVNVLRKTEKNTIRQNTIEFELYLLVPNSDYINLHIFTPMMRNTKDVYHI